MPQHAETRVLPYTPEQMFDLVADVARYPEFIPWVTAARIKSDAPDRMVADMVVGFKGLREMFRSDVAKERPGRIHVDYVEGPLKFLRNDWTFAPDPGGCRLDFSITFQFRSRLFEAIAGQVFSASVKRMVGAFEARAAKLYGAPATVGISSSSAHSAA